MADKGKGKIKKAPTTSMNIMGDLVNKVNGRTSTIIIAMILLYKILTVATLPIWGVVFVCSAIIGLSILGIMLQYRIDRKERDTDEKVKMKKIDKK